MRRPIVIKVEWQFVKLIKMLVAGTWYRRALHDGTTWTHRRSDALSHMCLDFPAHRLRQLWDALEESESPTLNEFCSGEPQQASQLP